MKLFYCDHFVLPLPPGHRFPMDKYRRLRERVVSGRDPRFELHPPPAASDAELGRVHDPDYIRRASRGELDARELRALGFPWSEALIERSRRSSGATIAACRAALAEGAAANLAGGTHHAAPAAAQGFCVFNDAAVAARAMQAEGRVQRVLIVDADVHQGNGTALCLAGDDSVFTFSIHGAKNFPFRKETSDLDVELADGTGDDEYLAALEAGLAQAMARAAGAQLVIYLAGADPYAGDRLGRLALSKAGLAARDDLVYRRCAAAGLPVAVAMAGGYADDIGDIVDIHYATLERAAAHAGR
ncbi:MAG: histone deacetylase [Proteobacteria bacterium]|nr:histone deacetylase [Pseudomonadota bacterium]